MVVGEGGWSRVQMADDPGQWLGQCGIIDYQRYPPVGQLQ